MPTSKWVLYTKHKGSEQRLLSTNHGLRTKYACMQHIHAAASNNCLLTLVVFSHQYSFRIFMVLWVVIKEVMPVMCIFPIAALVYQASIPHLLQSHCRDLHFRLSDGCISCYRKAQRKTSKLQESPSCNVFLLHCLFFFVTSSVFRQQSYLVSQIPSSRADARPQCVFATEI